MVIWSTVFKIFLAEMIPDFTAFCFILAKQIETGKKLKRSYLSSPKSNFKISSFLDFFQEILRRL